MGTVTLHCEIGDHDWERPKQKGKRPKNCPTHKAELEAARNERREAASESRLDRAKRKISDEQSLYELFTDEEARQVAYIDEVITTGLGAGYGRRFVAPREEADLNLLEDRRDAIMKQVRKRVGRGDT